LVLFLAPLAIFTDASEDLRGVEGLRACGTGVLGLTRELKRAELVEPRALRRGLSHLHEVGERIASNALFRDPLDERIGDRGPASGPSKHRERGRGVDSVLAGNAGEVDRCPNEVFLKLGCGACARADERASARRERASQLAHGLALARAKERVSEVPGSLAGSSSLGLGFRGRLLCVAKPCDLRLDHRERDAHEPFCRRTRSPEAQARRGCGGRTSALGFLARRRHDGQATALGFHGHEHTSCFSAHFAARLPRPALLRVANWACFLDRLAACGTVSERRELRGAREKRTGATGPCSRSASGVAHVGTMQRSSPRYAARNPACSKGGETWFRCAKRTAGMRGREALSLEVTGYPGTLLRG
jgi:hypothetical protein